jgi:DNA-binding NarL/FixJ family response regulator
MIARSAAATISVGIVADNDVTCAALACVIDDDPELVVVGTASQVRTGRKLLRSSSLHVLVVNLALTAESRRASGLAFIAHAKEVRPEVKVLSLKRGVEELHVRDALSAGADACCLTGAPQVRLVRAIKAVSVGGTWLDPEISELVFRPRHAQIEATPRLTTRERAVLQLITEGYSNVAIAAHLNCSAGTIHTHVLNLFEKLGVHDRTSAAVYAIRNGLIFENVIPSLSTTR